MNNLKITAKICGNIAYIDALRFDCILSAAYAKSVLQSDYYTSTKQCGSVELIINTLSEFLKFRQGVETVGIFHASVGFIKNGQDFVSSYSKRWNGKCDEFVKFVGKGRAEIDTARGGFKSYHNHIIYKACDEIVFYACGDGKKIAELLKNINYLGKKSAQGYGIVKQWIVEEIDEDLSLFHDGKPSRFLPIIDLDIEFDSDKSDIGYSALIPPAWRRDCVEMCITPQM